MKAFFSPLLVAFAMALAFTLGSLYFDREQSFASAGIRFLDPDDALRLAQVRSLLAGGGWFDPVIASIGDGGLHSHWSRLLDLPIAGLILLARLFVPDARAEQFAMMLWPKLILLGFMTAYLRQMIREAGAEAAAALLPMLWLAGIALIQFQLTRIDHHNIQNACAATAIILATAPMATRRSALAAGLVAGLGLVIGYEALPFIGLLAALLAACSLLDERRKGVAEGFAAGLALALAGGFVITVRPADWLQVPCDALGINVVTGAAIGAAGLILVGKLKVSTALRLAALGAAGIAAAGAFAWTEPVCLAGPFAKVDPAQWPLWMEHVNEARSLVRIAETKASLAIALGLSMLVCLGVQALVAWRSREAADIIRLLLLAVLTAVGFRYIKMVSYAQIVGFYCLAKAAFTLRAAHPQLTQRTVAMLAILLVTPVPMMLALSVILPDTKEETSASDENTCAAEKDFGALATMPRARILPQPDLGAYLALFGQHQTMIGNYHRLDKEIMRAAAVFAATPAEAKRLLDDWRIDLIVHCAGKRLYARTSSKDSLAFAIMKGESLPAYLEPIDLGMETKVKAWRVTRP